MTTYYDIELHRERTFQQNWLRNESYNQGSEISKDHQDAKPKVNHMSTIATCREWNKQWELMVRHIFQNAYQPIQDASA